MEANNPHFFFVEKISPLKCPTFQKPQILGCFSIDKEREFHLSRECLKYLILPKSLKNLELNLNRGYENVIHKPESARDEKLDHLLKFILHNRERLIRREEIPSSSLSPLLPFHFISYRGLLRSLMCTPYEYRNDWCVLATNYRGNIYLLNKETSRAAYERCGQNEDLKRILSYGFKFEQYVLHNNPSASVTENMDDPVNECEEFACVFNAKLEEMNLLYGAEIDGVLSENVIDSKTDLNKVTLVETKVKLRETSHRQKENFFQSKLLNWWSQSFLVGIENVHVGLRNQSGVVNEIQVLNLQEQRQSAKSYWHGVVCIEFLKNFLTEVKQQMNAINCPYTVFEYYWDPYHRKTFSVKEHIGKNEFSFLPEWYINEIAGKH